MDCYRLVVMVEQISIVERLTSSNLVLSATLFQSLQNRFKEHNE